MRVVLDLLDESLEHDSYQLVSQQNVAIRVFWSRSQPRLTLSARDLHHGKERVSPFYRDLFLLLKLGSDFHKRNVDETLAQSKQRLSARDLCHGKERSPCSIVIYSFFTKRTCFDFLRYGALLLWGQTTGLAVLSWIWVCIWLGWFGTFCLSSNFSLCLSSNCWTQLLHPIMFQGNLWRTTRWRIYLLVYDFSSFHPNNFPDTISWKCFVKNDSVSIVFDRTSILVFTARLMSTQYTVFWFVITCFVHVLCKTQCFQVDRIRMLMVFCPWDPQTWRVPSVCCSNFDLPVSILNWWWNVNWLHIECDKCIWRNHPE